MTDRDKNMYALGMLRMAKIVIAATSQSAEKDEIRKSCKKSYRRIIVDYCGPINSGEINIVDSDSVIYAMGVRDTIKKICTAIDATIDNVEDIFEKERV